MKRLYFISVFMLIILAISATSIYAANTTINPNGSSSVIMGSSNKITMTLTSNSKIGGVMGIIEKSSNVTSIKLTAKNGWNIMSYNEETGSFNMVKNEGANNEEFMEIEYTVANTEGTGKIDMKSITVSDIENYDEENLNDISKEFTIVKKQEEPKIDDDVSKTDNEEKNKDDGSSKIEENQNEDTSKNEKINAEQSVVSENNNQITGKTENKTTNKTVLPYTGVIGVVIPAIILILSGSSICAYLGYKKYKGIK